MGGLLHTASGQENHWTGLTDAKWWIGTNWGAGVPTAAHDVIFVTPVPGTGSAIALGAGSVANSLWAEDSYTFSGGDVTLTGGRIQVNLGRVLLLNSQLSGTAGLTKIGGGSLRLTNTSNDFAGDILIENGSLIITNPEQLGSGSSAIVVTECNYTTSNTSTVGFPGGSLVLDGSGGGFTVVRDLSLQGAGPINSRGGAVRSIGDNTLSGLVTMAAGTPTARATRIISNNGTLTLSGGLHLAGTTTSTLGGVNTTGAGGGFLLTGLLTGTGILDKAGTGTLFLSPSDASGFSGRIRIVGSASTGHNSVRVSSADVFGTATGTGTSSPIEMRSGILEIRSDDSLNIGKNVYLYDSSTFFAGPAVGGAAVNGTVTFGDLHARSGYTATFNSRNGYGMTFGAQTMASSSGNSTFNNNMGGLLTVNGNFWNNSDGSARTLTIGGSGNTVIGGSINTSGAGTKNLTKTGSGSLTIMGTETTLNGTVNIQGAIVITDFRSLNNNAGTINLGSTGSTAGALIVGTTQAATGAGLTTGKVLNLNGTTATASVYANQSGSDPVVVNSNFTATGGSASQNKTLVLGGTSTADNTINGTIPNNNAGGKVAVTKVGAGTWVLAGANTYTGTTTIANGTLKLRANGAISTVLPSTGAVTFNNSNSYAGGTLELVGQDGVNNVQNLGTLLYSYGANTLRVTPGTGGTASLAFDRVNTTGNSTLNIVGADATDNVVSFDKVNSATSSSGNGILTRSVYWEGTDYAFRDGVVMRAPVYGVDSGTATSSTTLSSGLNNEVTGSFATGSISVPTIKFAGSHALTINSGATLTLTGRGLLATGGAATITGGNALAAGDGALVVRVNQDTDTLTIDSIITGTGGLTKAGEGTLVLAGVNTRTGTTYINEGTLQLSGSGTLSGANVTTVIRQNGILDLNGVSTGTSIGQFTNNGIVTNTSGSAATLTLGNNNGTGTSYGIINETNGVIHVTKIGTGAQSWYGTSTYTGVTTIGSTGLITVDTLADIGQASGIGKGDATSDATNAASLVFNGSTGGLIYRGSIMEGNLALGSRSASTDRLFTLAGTGATLSSTVSLNNAIVWSNTGAIVHGVVGPQSLIFTGSSQGDNTFNPRLTDSGTGANITSVTKTGTGVWRLGNSNNTYSGATTINQGILMAADGQGLSSNSNLVFNGGTLYSQGTLNRNIGTGAGEMQFAPAPANTAQFSGGFLGGDSKLTVSWAGTPVWGHTTGFLDARDGLILNGSQALGQGATGSIALSEVEIAGSFSLGTAAATEKAITVSTSKDSPTITVTSGDTSGLVVGQSITGTNIPSGAYITSVNNATQFRISSNASASGTGITLTAIGNNLRAIRVDYNGNTGADFATISGDISAADSVTGIRKLGSGRLGLTGMNTYTGRTNVNQGVLAVTSLGNSTAPGPSSVGDSTYANSDASAVTLGNGGTGAGILQYIGAGEVSDRKVRLNTTTGSTQIHADGVGPLVLTNVANDIVEGAKILYLRGTNPEGNMITSQLSDNGGALRVTVDGSATWILTNGANDYTGITTNSAGALGIGHDGALGAGALVLSNGSVFAYGGDRTIANTVNQNNDTAQGFIGDYSLTFSSGYNLLVSSASVTLNNNILAGKSLTLNGVTADSLTGTRTWYIDGSGETIINGNITSTTANGLNIAKRGPGTLQLNGVKTIGTGYTYVNNGTLMLGVDNALPASTALRLGDTTPRTAGTLHLNGVSQTVGSLSVVTNSTTATNNLIVTPGNTLTVTGTVTLGANTSNSTTLLAATGGGAFVHNNSGGTFQVGGATGSSNVNAATADFSGLSSFTVNLGTGTMRIGDNSSVTGGSTATSTLILAPDSAITAGTLHVAANQPTALQTLKLGSVTTTLNVNTLNVGGSTRGRGLLEFASSTGTAQLRAADGVGRAAVNLGSGTTSTSSPLAGTVDLASHGADLLASTLTMADRSAGTGSTTAILTFDEGSLDATSVILARRTGSGTGNATGTLNLGGGTSTIGSLMMAENTSSGGAVVADLNITGGDVTVGTGSGTAINMANAGSGRSVTSNITLTGGALAVTGNILRTGGAGTENVTITLDGGSLDMSGNGIGSSATQIAFNAQSGTLGNLGELNGGGTLTKTTGGTLVLDGTNTYTGPTAVDAGTLLVNGAHTGGGAYHVQNGATLGGTGSIGSVVGVNSGGRLAPGASIGELAIDGNLTMAGDSVFEWEFNSDTVTADLLNLDGDLNLDPLGGVALELIDLADPASAVAYGTTFTLISYSGEWNGGIFDGYANNSAFFAGLNEWKIRYDADLPGINGGDFANFVTLTIIPEPTSLVLLLGAVMGLLLGRRRRTVGRVR
jgi:autotransporter-associated beta strand protein